MNRGARMHRNRRSPKKNAKRGIAWMLGTLIAVMTIVLVFAVVASIFIRVENSLETWNSKRYAILVANRLAGGSDGLAITINGMKHKNVFYKETLEDLASNPTNTRWMTPDQDLYCYNWHAKVTDFEEHDALCPHFARGFKSYETSASFSEKFTDWLDEDTPRVDNMDELNEKATEWLGQNAPEDTFKVNPTEAAKRRVSFYGPELGGELNYGEFKEKMLEWCKDDEQVKTGKRLTWEFGVPTPTMFHSIGEVIDEIIDEDIIGGLKEAKDTFASIMYNPPTGGSDGRGGADTLMHAIPGVNSIMEACAEEKAMENQMDPAGVPASDIMQCAKKWLKNKGKTYQEAKTVTFSLPVAIVYRGAHRTINDNWNTVGNVLDHVVGFLLPIPGLRIVAGFLGVSKAANWVKCNTICRFASVFEKLETGEKCTGGGLFGAVTRFACNIGKITKLVWGAVKEIGKAIYHLSLPPIRCVKLGSIDCRFCHGCEPPLNAQGPPEITQINLELQTDDEIHMGLLEVSVWRHGAECRNVVGEINDDGQIVIGLKDRKPTTKEEYSSD